MVLHGLLHEDLSFGLGSGAPRPGDPVICEMSLPTVLIKRFPAGRLEGRKRFACVSFRCVGWAGQVLDWAVLGRAVLGMVHRGGAARLVAHLASVPESDAT